MPELEFPKKKFNFKNFRNSQCPYKPHHIFPYGVFFKEPPIRPDYKEEIFDIYPESEEFGQSRTISLIELMNRRIEQESDHNTRSVCYLIISHS